MINEHPYEGLFKLIYTTTQCNEVINALEHAIDASYDTNKNMMTVLDSYMPYHVTNALLEIAEEKQISLREGASTTPFLKEVLETLKHAVRVDITLAFYPTYEQLSKIVQWWRKEINPQVVLNLSVDPKVVAGAKIGYNGSISDLTIKQDLNSFLEKS
ncbi:F0F1 ATP synthase subunit delta [Candidatus Woesebacteria bacterium]|nr:F0F1 ATP synthase subunit delta [Candidatus Woesebacteria bacterium]